MFLPGRGAYLCDQQVSKLSIDFGSIWTPFVKKLKCFVANDVFMIFWIEALWIALATLFHRLFNPFAHGVFEDLVAHFGIPCWPLLPPF